MTGKIFFSFISSFMLTIVVFAQKPVGQQISDSTTMDNYDDLFNELDALLDSLTAPKSFTLINIGIGSNYFNYTSKSSFLLESSKRITYTPSISYFSKDGWGASATSVLVNDGIHINPYQVYVTGSYDYMKNSHLMTGIAFTRFFTKDSLPFYTSPLKNELYAYFTYRNFWLKPCVAFSYGWGNRSAFEERESYITSLRLGLNGFTRVDTKESINDLNLVTSVHHDFYWVDVFGKKDYIRLTPQIVFTSGTQKFGFNQTSSTYATLPRTGTNVLYNTDNVFLDDQLYFQPLALSAYIKTEYSVGKFFMQPQLVFDYYFPASEKNFTTAFIINAGVIF